jgi:hypothetical protein
MAAQLMKKEEKIERLRFFQATRRPRVNRDAKTSRNRRWEDPGRVLRIRCSPITSHAVAFPPAAHSSLARAAAFSRRPTRAFFPARSSLACRRAPRFPIACRALLPGPQAPRAAPSSTGQQAPRPAPSSVPCKQPQGSPPLNIRFDNHLILTNFINQGPTTRWHRKASPSKLIIVVCASGASVGRVVHPTDANCHVHGNTRSRWSTRSSLSIVLSG